MIPKGWIEGPDGAHQVPQSKLFGIIISVGPGLRFWPVYPLKLLLGQPSLPYQTVWQLNVQCPLGNVESSPEIIC